MDRKPVDMRVIGVQVGYDKCTFRFGYYFPGSPIHEGPAAGEDQVSFAIPETGLRVSDLGDLAVEGARRLARDRARKGLPPVSL